jgi:multidrug efflux pump subunit AcrA (membrane-fusion protein)
MSTQAPNLLPANAADTSSSATARAGGTAGAPDAERRLLFRAEALAARQTQWLGPVLLAPRLTHRFFGWFAALAAGAMLALLVLGDYTRKARVQGWLVAHDGTLTLTAMHAAAGPQAEAPAPPQAHVLAHLYSSSRAVGMVRPGQRVRLRYDAFPHQRFGHHEGVVISVSQSPVCAGEPPSQPAGMSCLTAAATGSAPEALYRIAVQLDRTSIRAEGRDLALQPGMRLAADIALERRRLYQWMLDPLYAATGL